MRDCCSTIAIIYLVRLIFLFLTMKLKHACLNVDLQKNDETENKKFVTQKISLEFVFFQV